MGNIFKYLHRSLNLAKMSHFNLCEVSIPHPHLVWVNYRKQQDGIHISCKITLFPRGIWLKIKLCQNVVYYRSLHEFKTGREKLEHYYKMENWVRPAHKGEKRNKTNSLYKICSLFYFLCITLFFYSVFVEKYQL